MFATRRGIDCDDDLDPDTTDRTTGDSMSQPKDRVYTDAEITARVTELGLAGWYLEDGWLRRNYNTDGWPQTLMAVNAIGYVCEAAYHHADLSDHLGQVVG